MRYPPLPWPEDVERREMPEPFYAPVLSYVAVFRMLAERMRRGLEQ